ncbi:MAG TPA: malto-oligosyltrehalose synthase [Candidatus Acidoferrales bacterium]|nr:malto-oligosyltrehalose synthase [Candidatus Acidoferrales bacterium]
MNRNVPLATYRLQFNTDFRFRDAIAILDYLRELGISHIYASPVFTSRRGSGHGYDVTDPTRIDPDLGGEQGFAELQAALEERNMRLLLDIVPNHMAASSENRWWMDVLEFGPDSSFASYFDINWRTPSRSLENKLLLPFLARPFGEVLDSGELRITYEDGRLFLRYQEQAFPIAPTSYAPVLRYREQDLNLAVETGSSAEQEWHGIVAAAESIASDRSVSAQAATERRTKAEHLRERLRQLIGASPEMAAFLDRTLDGLHGTQGDPQSFCALERILSAQHYRLAFWQTASDSINYRRFFSITDLVGVRVEDPAVFDATHEGIIRAGAKRGISGFRIDHIDGLRDPRGYLARLRDRLSVDTSDDGNAYVVVEKILARDERLPSDWPVEGTTGYDYLNYANRLLVDGERGDAVLDVYSRWINGRMDFDELLYQKKKLVMSTLLAVEMRTLGRELTELASDDRYARELRAAELTEALIETTACLPIYRTYVQSLEEPENTQAILGCAIRGARERRPVLPAECFDFVADVLLLKAPPHIRADQRENRFAFVGRWQQFTGSIMAKGFEDTALYVYFPLASLNEVGGAPRGFDESAPAFHAYISERREKWRYSMNATTTHDTKRSEDARARIAVLSEIPEEWELGLQRWSDMNRKYATKISGDYVPDHNEEYLFYQTLIAAWPLNRREWPDLVKRVQDYLLKAVREAKVHTRWSQPNEAHESAVRDFIAGVLDCERNSQFCFDFQEFQKRTALYGMLNGLAQVLLKTACPGVTDIYQGSELWDFRLVDPDNRAPVDFARRISLFGSLHLSPDSDSDRRAQELLASWCDSRVKLYVLSRALASRRENAALFLDGDYRPLNPSGKHHKRIVAFARTHDRDWAIAIAPRCVASVGAPVIGPERVDFWRQSFLNAPDDAPKSWVNILAGREPRTISAKDSRLCIGDVFEDFPIALLVPTAALRLS